MDVQFRESTHFSQVLSSQLVLTAGLEINARKFANASDFDNVRVKKKYPRARVRELESSMSPKQRERIC